MVGKILYGIRRYFQVSSRHSQTYAVYYLVIMLHKNTASSSLPLHVDQQGNRSFASFMWHVCSKDPTGQNRNGRMGRGLKGSLVSRRIHYRHLEGGVLGVVKNDTTNSPLNLNMWENTVVLERRSSDMVLAECSSGDTMWYWALLHIIAARHFFRIG